MTITSSFDMLVAADYLEQTGAEGFLEVAKFLREQHAKATAPKPEPFYALRERARMPRSFWNRDPDAPVEPAVIEHERVLYVPLPENANQRGSTHVLDDRVLLNANFNAERFVADVSSSLARDVVGGFDLQHGAWLRLHNEPDPVGRSRRLTLIGLGVERP